MKINLVRRLKHLFLSVFLPFVFLILMSQLNVQAANLLVTTTHDGGSGSLRQAVLDANQNPGPDTITFDLAPQSIITLTYGLPSDFIVISDTLTIDGGTAVSLSISGNNERNIFSILAGTAVTLTDLTLMHSGDVFVFNAGAIHNDGGYLKVLRTKLLQNGAADDLFGGAIFNKSGTIILQDSQLHGNKAEYGAGILNGGDLEITDSIFQDNAGRFGAGILNCNGGVVSIKSSRFLNHFTEHVGSAIYNAGKINGTWPTDHCSKLNSQGILHITNSTVNDNYSFDAGAGSG